MTFARRKEVTDKAFTDKASIRLKEIAQILRAALPHHAPGVTRLSVRFGDRVVQFISLDSSK